MHPSVIVQLVCYKNLKKSLAHNRSWGLAILLNGTSSSLAQEHSTTANPFAATMSLSAGLTGKVPFGLQAALRRIVGHRVDARTYDRTMPRNRWPTLRSAISPARASFFPEQRRGSHWSKSWHMFVCAVHSLETDSLPTWPQGPQSGSVYLKTISSS